MTDARDTDPPPTLPAGDVSAASTDDDAPVSGERVAMPHRLVPYPGAEGLNGSRECIDCHRMGGDDAFTEPCDVPALRPAARLVLEALWKYGPLDSRELEQYAHVPRATMFRAVKQLEAKHLINRARRGMRSVFAKVGTCGGEA